MTKIKQASRQYPLQKLDKNGNFSHFPGISIVSNGYSQQPLFCKAIYHALFESTRINEYYSLLPVESYHLTEVNLCNEAALGEEWKNVILDNIDKFREINDVLRKYPIQPVIDKIEVDSGETIMLMISLPEPQITQIKAMASKLAIEDGLPEAFHITLAYARPLKKPSKKVSEQLELDISERINKVLTTTMLPVQFGPATLCYFNDMTALHPWCVDDYPFQEPIQPHTTLIRSSSSCSFFKEHEKEDTEKQYVIERKMNYHEV